MNNAQIDHLLQATAPRLDSLTGAARARDTGPPFDNLFRQASEASASTAQAPAPTLSSSSSSPVTAGISAPATDSHSDDRPASSSPEEALTTDSASEAPAAELADVETTENSGDTGDEPQENAEVVALLAAERASAVKVVDQPAEEIDVEAVSIDASATAADPAADDAGSDPKTKTTGAENKAGISSPATSDVEPVESVDPVKDVESQADNSLATLEAAAEKSKREAAKENGAIAVGTVSAETVESEPQARSADKPFRNSDQAASPVTQQNTEQAVADPAVKLAATTTATASAKAAPSVEHVEAPKSEKKSAVRADSATREAATAPTERPTSAPRVVEPSTGTATAANVQQPTLVNRATAVATNSAVKSAGGATESKPGILASLNRLDRSSAPGARGTNRPGQAESGPNVDPARFISRVARAVQTAQERGAPLQLRLSPPELGAMRLELSMNQGALTATIETDNTNAKQLLLDNLPALRDRLSDQNIKIERFDVDVRRDPSGNQQNHAPQDRDQQQRNHANSSFDGARRQSAVATLDEPQPLRRTISNTSINVVA